MKLFKPKQIRTRKGSRAYRNLKQVEQALRDPRFSRVVLGFKMVLQKEEFVIFNFDDSQQQLISWNYPAERNLSEDLSRLLIPLVGFNAMHCHDRTDLTWQSETMAQNYKIFKRPWEHLPTYTDPDTSHQRVDISGNPGRKLELPGMRIVAAWRMWYGRGAFPFLPRERLLSFPDAHRIEELENDVVFIELYEDPLDYENPENRRRQQAFRDWMGLDELAAKAPKLLQALPSDPAIEIDEGKFPHGGVRRLREWFDAEDLPCSRSKASYCIEVEYDAHGNDLWQGKIPVGQVVD